MRWIFLCRVVILTSSEAIEQVGLSAQAEGSTKRVGSLSAQVAASSAQAERFPIQARTRSAQAGA